MAEELVFLQLWELVAEVVVSFLQEHLVPPVPMEEELVVLLLVVLVPESEEILFGVEEAPTM